MATPSAAAATIIPNPKRGLLKRLTVGRIDVPDRVFLYGVEGIGKSTLAASAPAPIFLGAEDGTAQLDIARLPQPSTWQDVLDSVQELISEPHGYRTFVIDTVDWMEPIVWDLLCERDKVDTIEKVSKGYGKGYIAAADLWRVLLAKLDELRHTRKMGIILLGHAQVKTFKNPLGEDYDTYTPKLNKLAAALLSEWCDSLLFTNWTTLIASKGDDRKTTTYGMSDGTRVMYTERRAAWTAKNRHGLPFELPLSWTAYAEAVKLRSPEAMVAQIGDLLEQIMDVDITKKVEAAIKDAKGDMEHLAAIANRCREILDQARQGGETT